MTKQELYNKLWDIGLDSVGDKDEDRNAAEFVLLCYVDDPAIHSLFRKIAPRLP